MIRVGILGTGFGARVHLPAFNLDKRAKVVAIYGRNSEKVKTISAANNIEGYSDWREMLASPDIDAISIALPPQLQAEVLREIPKYKKHVFVEKPVGLGASATLKLANELDSQKIIHSLDFEFPFLPSWQDFFLKAQTIGEIQHLKVNWHVKTTAYSGAKTWKIDLQQGGGTLSNLACHSLHYTEWLMGEAQSVIADLGTDESQVDLILEFAANKKAVLSISMNTQFGNGHRLELFGTKGALTLENVSSDYMNNFTLKIKTDLGEKIESDPVDDKFSDGRVTAVNRVVKRFLDGIESGRNNWPNLHDGARNEMLLKAARKSHETCQKIKI